MIPYGKQDIDQQDIDSVISVLTSDFLTQGPIVPEFEKSISSYCSAKFSVALNSATSALHLACLALNVSKGDVVWTSPNTFVASANCALYCNATIDFVDIDPKTYNLCPNKLEDKLERTIKKGGKLPKVVIPVHFAGQSCDMKSIGYLKEKYGFSIIEDASHAIGGKYLNNPIGGCQFSDITVFSFHPVKIITTAEGGVAATNNYDLYKKIELLRSHGITRDPHNMTHAAHGEWYYQQIELGFNYRMTELQAALGVSQMQKLDKFVSLRHQIAMKYDRDLQELPITLPFQSPDCYSSYHLYPIRLNLSRLSLTHPEIFKELRRNGLGVNLHYIPVHTQPYYQKFGFKIGDFPNAESYYNEVISIPIFSALTETDRLNVVDILRRVIK